MTKTQALQRLYKALTGEEGRNTGSKIIEDLAVAAENGEIGGGGVEMATVKFTMTTGAMSAMENVGIVIGTNIAGLRFSSIPFTMKEQGLEISAPLMEGTSIGFEFYSGDYTITPSGSAEAMEGEEGIYFITGDCGFHFENA